MGSVWRELYVHTSGMRMLEIASSNNLTSVKLSLKDGNGEPPFGLTQCIFNQLRCGVAEG